MPISRFFPISSMYLFVYLFSIHSPGTRTSREANTNLSFSLVIFIWVSLKEARQRILFSFPSIFCCFCKFICVTKIYQQSSFVFSFVFHGTVFWKRIRSNLARMLTGNRLRPSKPSKKNHVFAWLFVCCFFSIVCVAVEWAFASCGGSFPACSCGESSCVPCVRFHAGSCVVP